MRWYEYKMETDDLCAPDDLKTKLLAMTDQLTEEEKAQPMMKAAAPAPAQFAPVQPKKKLIRFPVKTVKCLSTIFTEKYSAKTYRKFMSLQFPDIYFINTSE